MPRTRVSSIRHLKTHWVALLAELLWTITATQYNSVSINIKWFSYSFKHWGLPASIVNTEMDKVGYHGVIPTVYRWQIETFGTRRYKMVVTAFYQVNLMASIRFSAYLFLIHFLQKVLLLLMTKYVKLSLSNLIRHMTSGLSHLYTIITCLKLKYNLNKLLAVCYVCTLI